MRPAEPAAPPRAGFTLLEVLVAVSVLGLLYTVLAGVALQGLRAEGEATRRLEAAVLAEETLAQIEAQLDAGTAPPLGRQESEAGPFEVTVEVSPLDLALAPKEPGQAEREPGPTLLSGATRGNASALRRVEVRVSWLEGNLERTVTRNTFGLDAAEAAKTLTDLLAPTEEGS